MTAVSIFTFIRYTLVGTIGLVFDATSLYLMVEFGRIQVMIAAAIAFMIAIIVSFVLHRIWTFKDHSHNIKRQFLSFFLISCINFVITLVCMYLFVEVLFIWYMLAKLITATIVLIWSYTANRLWTFKKLHTRTPQ